MINYNKICEASFLKNLKPISPNEENVTIDDESVKTYYVNQYERKLVPFFI
jgi:hypothetical protein